MPETIEAPAKHINIVSEPVPMPDFDKEEKPAEQPADEKPSENEPPTEDTDEHKE